ncbi:hypothetical protein GCM10028895_17760 [Pontibacter rugosus]
MFYGVTINKYTTDSEIKTGLSNLILIIIKQIRQTPHNNLCMYIFPRQTTEHKKAPVSFL